MNKELIKERQMVVSKWWKNTKTPSLIDLLLMVMLLGVTTVCFLYGDVEATIEHSFNFLDSVFSGKFLDFYQIAIENGRFGHPAVYDFPIYVVFAIWNLPVYILHKLIEIDYLNSFGCLLWSKMMMVFFTLVAAKILMEIGKELGLTRERCKWVAFFFMTGSMVIIPAIMIVQYDIVAIVFMLLGIRAYMRGDTKSFILWFALANTMKLFGVFVFVPLVLLHEKRIFYIVLQFISGMAGVLICKLIYGSNAAYIASTKAFSATMLSRLQATSIKWQYEGFSLPLFVVLMAGVCIFAYIKKIQTSQERKCFAVYFPFVVFLGFMGLVPFNPYWMILAAPFMIQIIFITPQHLKLNVLLETAIGAMLVWVSVMINYPVFGNNMLRPMLLGKVISPYRQTRYEYMSQIFVELGLGEMINIVAALLLACITAMIIINYPRKKYIDMGVNEEHLERGIVWFRGAVPCGFVLLMILCYILPASGLIYTSTAQESNIYTSGDLLSDDIVVEEKWTFDNNLEVTKIEIGFATDDFAWIDSSIVNLSITSNGDDKVVWEESRPVNLFSGTMETFKTGKLHLQKNQEYTLTITAQNGEGTALSVKYNNDYNNFATYENGNLQSGNLCLNIYGVWES